MNVKQEEEKAERMRRRKEDSSKTHKKILRKEPHVKSSFSVTRDLSF
jgi:hypothetical protein